MIFFIISVLIGLVGFLVVGLIIRPIYIFIRDLIRILLYLTLRIDTYSTQEKREFGWLPPAVPPVAPETPGNIVTNCILSKKDFPNIEKYVPNYKEHLVEEPKKNIFEGMDLKQHLNLIENLQQKEKDGTLDSMEKSILEVLSSPEVLENAKVINQMLKRINKY